MKKNKILNKQLALPFQFVKLQNQQNFLINSCNKMAISLIEELDDVEKFKEKYTNPVLIIHGPEGSGKSHLAHIFKQKKNAIFINKIENQHLALVKNGKNFIFDDFEKQIKIDEKKLFHFLNETYTGKGSVLLLSKFAPSKMKCKLPDLNSRIRGLMNAEITLPNDQILYSFLVKILDEKNINLTDKHCLYIIKRIKRNYKSVLKFVEELDRYTLEINKKISTTHLREVLFLLK
jgi:chromosomal replication initiation ATPase DnaA|tara:strand:+ start:2106 stop:2807 length:702 start_codon:yes stop_codon:yes gene_type:complete